jgi:RecA-family ATPase
VSAPAVVNVVEPEDWLPTELLPASRLLDVEFPPVTFAIVPYFPRAEVTELVGAHGIFKSTVALGACLSVAAARSWGGAFACQGRSVFVSMEDGERTLAWRVRAWLEGVPAGQDRSDAEADLRENFEYLAREQAQDLAVTHTDRNATVIRPAVVERITQLVDGAHLVVLETASRLHDGPEMNEALAVFARAIERIAMESGAAVVIVRHVSKQAAREGTTDSYAGRGGGALSDAARSVLVMARDRKPEGEDDADPFAPVRLTHAKSTHARPGPRIVWKPMAVEHGVYLHSLTQGDETREAARRLHGHLVELGHEGITRTELHQKPPAGLGRNAAKAALEHLVEAGRVVASEEERGRNRQVTKVYRAAEGES